MNKFMLSGSVVEPPQEVALGGNLLAVKINASTVIRLNSQQSRELETIHTVYLPKESLRDTFEVDDRVYFECSYIPAYTLTDQQHFDLIWANIIHLTPAPLSKAV